MLARYNLRGQEASDDSDAFLLCPEIKDATQMIRFGIRIRRAINTSKMQVRMLEIDHG